MGSLLSVKFSKENDVTLFVSNKKTKDYSKNMQAVNLDTDVVTAGDIKEITDDLEHAVENAEWIFITYPSFLFKDFSAKLVPLLKKGQHLVFVPGSGGAELFFREALNKGCTISGLQRVHCVARIKEKGVLVIEQGIRSSIAAASVPRCFNEEACEKLEELFKIKVKRLGCYLNVTFVNSNPILHTSRLYSVFKDFKSVKEYDCLPLFYEQWSNESSVLLEKADGELFEMIEFLKNEGLNVDSVTPLLEHYESENARQMTAKLNSIQSLKGLKTPYVVNDNGKFVPDLQSRYFKADFPFGLDILLAFAKLLKIETPNMETMSLWYHDIVGGGEAI